VGFGPCKDETTQAEACATEPHHNDQGIEM
jgi:hypothetical protein